MRLNEIQINLVSYWLNDKTQKTVQCFHGNQRTRGSHYFVIIIIIVIIIHYTLDGLL